MNWAAIREEKRRKARNDRIVRTIKSALYMIFSAMTIAAVAACFALIVAGMFFGSV